MLASLKDKDAYGSDMHQSLKDKYGIDSIKPVIYTMLRRMEKAELVVSKWDVKSSGPAKRVYRITEEGLEYLKESTEGLRKVVTVINMLLGKEGKPDG
jgi:DNA-binding PadR family transcriptional regulator